MLHVVVRRTEGQIWINGCRRQDAGGKSGNRATDIRPTILSRSCLRVCRLPVTVMTNYTRVRPEADRDVSKAVGLEGHVQVHCTVAVKVAE